MIDTRLFFFVIGPELLGNLTFFTPAAFHDEGFLQQQGEGWVPVDHTITPTGDGSALLSIMCTRETDVTGLIDSVTGENS